MSFGNSNHAKNHQWGYFPRRTTVYEGFPSTSEGVCYMWRVHASTVTLINLFSLSLTREVTLFRPATEQLAGKSRLTHTSVLRNSCGWSKLNLFFTTNSVAQSNKCEADRSPPGSLRGINRNFTRPAAPRTAPPCSWTSRENPRKPARARTRSLLACCWCSCFVLCICLWFCTPLIEIITFFFFF